MVIEEAPWLFGAWLKPRIDMFLEHALRAPSPPTTFAVVVLLPSFYRRKSLDGFDWLEPDCQRAPQGRHYPTQCSRVEPLSPMWVLHLRELTAIQADYTNPGESVKAFDTIPRIN